MSIMRVSDTNSPPFPVEELAGESDKLIETRNRRDQCTEERTTIIQSSCRRMCATQLSEINQQLGCMIAHLPGAEKREVLKQINACPI